jgi:hypothetical protein
MNTTGLPDADVHVLRDLGEWQAEAAASTANQERIAAWHAHDAWAPDRRPMVLMEMRNWEDGEGPVDRQALRCTDPWAQVIERDMRMLRHHVEVLQDDHVVPPYVPFAPPVRRSSFGVPSGRHREEGADRMAFNYTPPLTRLDDDDFARLTHRTSSLDLDAMNRTWERLEAIFEGLLPARLRDGRWQFATCLTAVAFDLVGLEGFMLLMYDNPDGLHRLMDFLREDEQRHYDWFAAQDWLPLNNGADYVGAGSVGFTHDLPRPGFAGSVGLRDRWHNFNSQESVSISPDQYGEFVFAYMEPLMVQFGKVYYGCCEPVHGIWQYLSTLPNLARVSVSPWADQAFMGQACRRKKVVFSRKPSPNLISFERFDEQALRDHFAETVAEARGCSLEIIQRDIYTTHHSPDRLRRWVELARDACGEWSAEA